MRGGRLTAAPPLIVFFFANDGDLLISFVAGLKRKRTDLNPRLVRRDGLDHLALLGGRFLTT